VPVRLVTAPTLVFSQDGNLIPGLDRGDFRVYDNGRLQKASLDTVPAPVSVVVAVQVNRDVREYVPFIARTGSTIEALLVGATGESAAIAYSAEIKVLKPFETGDLQSTIRKMAANGSHARMIDAGMRAVGLLKERPSSRNRVLLFIGQPIDSGSESMLAELREAAERESVSIYALTLPEIGKALVSDTFALQGLSSSKDKGGFKAGVNLGKLIPVLSRTGETEVGTDPFSVLTAATGGNQFHFRRQNELEDAIAAIGVVLRSAYLLSYSPNSTEPGYHTISIEVGVPGAKTCSRPGYWLGGN
jgi:VWFA-related protein